MKSRQRNTKQRKMIVDAVQKADLDHPSADDIYLYVREKDFKISRGTVYRNLHQLADNGKVQHVRIPGVDRFDCRTDLHYHLLCTGCKKVSDVPIPYQTELDQTITQQTDYEIVQHLTVFEGLCPLCRKKS